MTMPRRPQRFARPDSRGFTLAELMAVVVIIGVLATLAAVGYRKYVNAAKQSEAPEMIQGIKAAQEAYRAETLTYLDVCAQDLNAYYPDGAPLPAQKAQWGGGTNDIAKRWRILNVAVAGPVYFGYSTIAGGPGATIPVAGYSDLNDKPTFTTPIEPWYLVKAKGDIDGDAVGFSICLASSFTTDVYCEGTGK